MLYERFSYRGIPFCSEADTDTPTNNTINEKTINLSKSILQAQIKTLIQVFKGSGRLFHSFMALNEKGS